MGEFGRTLKFGNMDENFEFRSDEKQRTDKKGKGGNCDASVISVPFVAPVVSGSITVDSALKGKGVIDSAMNSNSSPNASTLVSKEPVASSDMAIASPLPLKPVVVTPWPSALQNGRNVIAGFSNKFSALAAPVETVLSDIVVYVHLPEDVTTSIDGAHVEIDSSPKKTRAAAKAEIVSFFTGLIGTKDPGVVGADSSLVRELLSFTMPVDVVDLLVSDVTDEEIKVAIF
ncbi:hypothetical protein V6N12_022424 [Hibiscus sabdariffa]|uniref:Uncharacterized protein n=1 Tax=Hibiscus sabdariffa TaxID=183260 RepID=A0ABR2FUZ8_9ROSI